MSGPTPAGTVPAMLQQRVAASPEAAAFCREQADGSWAPMSWRDFKTQVDQLAVGLVHHGLSRGDKLALIAPVSLEWELLHHAALSVGIVVVGLDSHDLPARVATMCETADITAIATTSTAILSALQPERAQRLRFVIDLPGNSELPAADTTRLTLERLKSAATGKSAEATHAPAPDDVATIIFTSGTTGEPKGIAYDHAQVCLAIDGIGEAYDFVGPGSHLLCWLPLSNLFQRMVNLAGMRNGAATYLLADPRRVMDVVAGVAPDIFVSVPRFYEKLYDGICHKIEAMPPLRRRLAQWAWHTGRSMSRCRLNHSAAPVRLKLSHALAERLVLRRIRSVMGQRLRCMVSGSAPMPLHLLHELHALGWLVLEAYGLSENILPMAMNRLDDYRFGTVGRPLAANDLTLDADGAIKVRSPGLFKGYLREEDRPPFDSEGYYLTGDLGHLDGDDYLCLSGRSGEMIKTSTGRRVAPSAIEAQLRRAPGIDQAVLIGNGRKCLITLCSLINGKPDKASREVLVAALRQQVMELPASGRPLGVVIVERPLSVDLGELTPNLKLRRQEIERLHQALISTAYEIVEHRSKSDFIEPAFMWMM